MNFIQSLALGYVLVLLVFTLGFLVNWYRNRAAMSPYKQLGFWAGVIFVIFELLESLFSRVGFPGIGNLCLIFVALGWGFLRMWGFVNNGIFFSNRLNLRSFPLIAPQLGVPPAPAEAPAAAPAVDQVVLPSVEESKPGADSPFENEVVPPAVIEIPTSPFATPIEPEPIALPAIHWLRYGLNIIGVSVGAVVYSAVLFHFTQPQPGLIVQNTTSSVAESLTPTTLLVLLEFAFVEELMFRLGIQNFLGAKLIKRRYGYAIAVVLTAALWSLGHIGSLNPDWVKLAQIFPLGLALGWLFRRQGTESCIMTHALFNVLGGLLLSPSYLR